jgi:hypothetical protein
MNSEDSNDSRLSDKKSYSDIIQAVGQALGSDWFPSSQRASLRRLGLSCRSASETVALRILIEAGAPLQAMSFAEMRNWAWLVHCMALMSVPNRNPHSTAYGAGPGFVLHRIGYGEVRLGRLLDAYGDAFQKLIEHAAWRMSKAGAQMNWWKIAPLILSADPRSPWAENARIAISRDFLLANARSSLKRAKSMTLDDTLLTEQVS